MHVIERALSKVAARLPAGQQQASHILYICACITADDSPDWTICGTAIGVGWRSWPDGLPSDEEREGAADATYRSHVHAQPDHVLAWLEGRSSELWEYGEANGDSAEVRSGLERWFSPARES